MRIICCAFLLPVLIMMVSPTLAGAATVDYQTESAGLVSLGIYDAGGHLLRTLQSGKRQDAGAYKVEWDGKDDAGKPCAPGAYQLRGVVGNLKVDLQLVAGNPGDPPYFTADGKGAWNGHWGNPLAVCADDNAVYMQFSGEEGCGSLLKLDYDGRVQWKAHLFQGDGNGSQLAAATDGKYVYIAADNPVGDYRSPQRRGFIWRVDADRGEYANWNGHGFAVGQPYDEAPLPFWEYLKGPLISPPDVTGANGGANVRGLVVKDDKLYVPLYREDKIEVWDVSDTPKLATTIDGIAKPQGMAVDTTGNLFVASRRRILKLTPDGQRGAVVATGLLAPYGVAVDAAGNLYVSDLGRSQQVKKFSPAGKLLWASGKAGGRPWQGKHEPENFLMPAGLAATKNGRVFVGENAVPRRSVILDAVSGKLWKELMGTLDIGAGVGLAVDEADPSTVYIMHPCASYLRGMESIVRYKIDYAKRTWRVDAYWAGMGASAWQNSRSGLALSNPRIVATGGSDFFVRHRGKYTYLCSGLHLNHGIWRVDGYNLIPSAAVGSMSIGLPVDLDQGFTVNAQHNLVTSTDPRQFAWHDTNGDGLVSSDEVTFWQVLDPKMAMHAHGSWGAYYDRDMNFYYPDEPGDGNIYKIPCVGTDAHGNPLYDWSQAAIIVPAANTFMAEAPYDRFAPWDKERAGQIYRKHCERIKLDTAGNVFGTTEIMGQDQGIGWASSTLAVKVGGWDAQGNLRWLAGSKAKAFAKPGQFYTGKGVDGTIRGFAFFTDENGQSRVYSGDGLYVGSLLDDMYRGPAPGPNQVSIEYCGGRVFTHPQTGDDYLLAGDGAGLHFWKILGLQDVQRFTVPVTLTAGAAAGAPTPPSPPTAVAGPPPTQGWEIVESVADLHTSNLYGIAFGSALNGAVVGEGPEPKLSYSADGGVTWQPAAIQSATTVTNPMDVCFTGEQTGWVTGIGMTADNKRVTILLKTEDGGVRWQEVNLPPQIAALNAYRVWFAANNQDGYVLPYSYGALAKTADGGRTWQLIRYPDDPALEPCRGGARTTGLHVFDAQHLLVTTSCGLLLETRDGGATWKVLPVAPEADMWAIDFVSEQEGWVTGSKGLIMHTSDGGATWARQESGFPGTLERVQFVSPLEGYAVAIQPQVGIIGALLHTADGGKTWKNTNPAASSLRALFLLDAKHGWACGGRGGGYETPAMILRYAP